MIKPVNELLQSITQYKERLDQSRPFDQFQLQNLRQRFRIWFIQSSNWIEWNTMTLSEVKVLLEDWVTVWWKTLKELKETLNHNEVMKELHDFFDISSYDITEKIVKHFHSILLHETVDKKYLGVWRNIDIKISWVDDAMPKPSLIAWLMNEYFISEYITPQSLEDVARIHWNFVKIHPFVDGNWRIARLLMNIWIVSLWYFPVTIPVVVRREYIDSLKWDDFASWYHFFLRQVNENHKDYVRFLEK